MASRKCKNCDHQSETTGNLCPACGKEYPTNTNVYIFYLFVLVVIALIFLFSSEEIEEQIKTEDIAICVKGSSGYKGKHYKNACKDKSVQLTGVVKAIDGNEVTLYTSDQIEYGSHKFYVYPKSNRFKVGLDQKVIVEGIFDSYSFGGYARVDDAVIKPIELADSEINARQRKENAKKLKSQQKENLFAYMACAEEFELSKPGTECPKASDLNSESAHLQEDGSINVDGLCFFGKLSITFSCEFQNGLPTIKEFKIH